MTDDQWKIVETILPEGPVRDDGRGRPRSDRRKVLNGVLWILRTGAPWRDLRRRYGPYQTAHRRCQNWVRSGVIERILLALAQHLKEAGGLDLQECFVDGTFVPAKKSSVSRTPAGGQETGGAPNLGRQGSRVLRAGLPCSRCIGTRWSPPAFAPASQRRYRSNRRVLPNRRQDIGG